MWLQDNIIWLFIKQILTGLRFTQNVYARHSWLSSRTVSILWCWVNCHCAITEILLNFSHFEGWRFVCLSLANIKLKCFIYFLYLLSRNWRGVVELISFTVFYMNFFLCWIRIWSSFCSSFEKTQTFSILKLSLFSAPNRHFS